MERQGDGTCIKKGPWTAEEDEVLLNYVNEHGPRDWSSIRSKGLLPRTGKSCRLRWVNKLRPNLKTTHSGCKFSAEEERVVIELQAHFGNKWAKIATYLSGRTDNDVKNFWSTRRKRLERILQTSPPNSQQNKGKDPVFHELPILEVPACGFPAMQEGSPSGKNQCLPLYPESSEEYKMMGLPGLGRSNSQTLEADLPALETISMQMVRPIESVSVCPFSQPQLDLSLIPECEELAIEPCDPNFLDMFKQAEHLEAETGPKSVTSIPPMGLKDNAFNAKHGGAEAPPSPDSFFVDFSPEMFDYLEPLPSSSGL